MSSPAGRSGIFPAFIGLGSNLHQPAEQVLQAMEALSTLPQTRLVRGSSLYLSAPVGFQEQPDFINAVAHIETGLSPRALLAALLDLEHRHGRVRARRNGPRVIDLDLLLHADLCCEEPGLSLPHPRMHERAFVLQPLAEIAPDCRIPGQGLAVDCLRACDDQFVARWQPGDRV